MKPTVLVSWSTGKDSAWSLHRLRQQAHIEVVGLFCTVNKQFQRTAMHAVRLELLRMQAFQAGLPLEILEIPYPCSNAEYATIMRDFVDKARERGIRHFAFGDLFLEDIREYRVNQLKSTGIEPLFPLWREPTKQLASEMIRGGLKAVVTCIDPKALDKSFAGREFDEDFLRDLPASVDPCGENGEFHSFVFEGPMFKNSIPVEVGDTVERDGFFFADVIPKNPA